MPELDDAALERRLRGVLQEHLGALPLDLTVDALDRRREAKGAARRSARGRGITLLAAAALLLVGGALAGSGILRLPSIVRPVPAPSFAVVTTASPDAASPSPSDLAGPSAGPTASPVTSPGGAWIATGTMGTPRYEHAAVRLLDGRVLVAGGTLRWEDRPDGQIDLTSAELYDPASGTWSATGNMLKRQAGFPPTLLLDGRVLAGDSDDAAADVLTIGSEVYDPASGTWSAAGKVFTSGDFGAPWPTATLLRDGKVLVSGQGDAHVYDPGSGAWSATGKMITPRHNHTATLLRDGKVLVAGGADGGDSNVYSAELYDPDTGSWTAIANPHREGCKFSCSEGGSTATLLHDGTVLFMRFEFAEIYDPATGTWTALAERAEYGYQTATLLSDGIALVAGLVSRRADSPQPPCTAAALYDPRTGSWTTTSSMLRCGNGASSTLLLDGTVLVAGGKDCQEDVCVATGAAELYVPGGVSPPPLPAFPSPPPPVFPSPTPIPTPLPPAAGPVPTNARSWKVTVVNKSSEPATLFVAEPDGRGMLQLVGSATPNVVPAGATVKVTFLFPAKGDPDGGWIFVNPRPGDEGGLIAPEDFGIPGKILIREDGVQGWLSP